MNDKKIELIMIVCNHGFAEEIMNTARSFNAKGGTIMSGRSTASSDVKKFLGIEIHPEKDIILILSPLEDKKNIMQGIADKWGITTEAHAICFSLPVDEVVGLNL
ncbi:MAG: P-II family nitrogen regulator [Bacilli bacterium]|nr:P-II family nitrogen regulator [Bacilli bacterium]